MAKRCEFWPKFYVENPYKLYNSNGVDLQFILSKVLSCYTHYVRPRILFWLDPSYRAKIYVFDVIMIL